MIYESIHNYLGCVGRLNTTRKNKERETRKGLAESSALIKAQPQTIGIYAEIKQNKLYTSFSSEKR
jgi:hypothetical protein